jgi:heme/copper-type cytochrome/quinol oxidase subunit 2
MPDIMTVLPWSNAAALNGPTLFVAVVFYLVAGWRTWQVIMLTSRRDDPTAQAYVAGTMPIVVPALFIACWLPILIVSTAVALIGRGARRGGGAPR